MSGVATRFRQSISRALSISDIEDSDMSDEQSILGKSVNFFAKFAQNNNTHHQPERRHKTLLVIDSRENDW